MIEIDDVYLMEQRKKQDAYTIVFYNVPGCDVCIYIKQLIESVMPNFPEIEFVSYQVKDLENVSLFAPAYAPVIMLFVNGYKVKELSSMVEHKLQLIKIIKSWIL